MIDHLKFTKKDQKEYSDKKRLFYDYDNDANYIGDDINLMDCDYQESETDDESLWALKYKIKLEENYKYDIQWSRKGCTASSQTLVEMQRGWDFKLIIVLKYTSIITKFVS